MKKIGLIIFILLLFFTCDSVCASDNNTIVENNNVDLLTVENDDFIEVNDEINTLNENANVGTSSDKIEVVNGSASSSDSNDLYTVNKTDTSLIINPVNGTVGHKLTLNASIVSSNNLLINEGTVTFFDGETNIGNSSVLNGVATLSYIPAVAGEHTITAIFNSDNYLTSTQSINFTAYKLQTRILVLNVVTWRGISQVSYGDGYCNPKLGIYTPDVIYSADDLVIPIYEKLKNYVAYFNGSSDNVIINDDGSFYLRNLTPGTYTLFVKLNDSNREGNASFNINIEKGYTSLSIPEINIVYGEYGNSTAITRGASVELGFNNPYGTPISMYTINEEYKNYIRVDGHIITVLPGLEVGNHTINFIVKDNCWQSQTCEFKVNVIARNTSISADNVNAVYNNAKYLTINLKDNEGNAIIGETLLVVLNGKTYIPSTDSNGQAKLYINDLLPKNYPVTITFAGNAHYNKSAATVDVNIKKATPKISAKAKTFKKSVKTKRYSITLKDNLNKVIKNTKVTLKVNKKTYVAKTNSKGVAVFKIKKLTKKGTFKSTITYKGNSYYNKVTKKVNIKVK